MTWKKESERHKLASNGIKTVTQTYTNDRNKRMSVKTQIDTTPNGKVDKFYKVGQTVGLMDSNEFVKIIGRPVGKEWYDSTYWAYIQFPDGRIEGEHSSKFFPVPLTTYGIGFNTKDGVRHNYVIDFKGEVVNESHGKYGETPNGWNNAEYFDETAPEMVKSKVISLKANNRAVG